MYVLKYLQGARPFLSSKLRRSAVQSCSAGGNICLVSYPRERPMPLYEDMSGITCSVQLNQLLIEDGRDQDSSVLSGNLPF